MTLLIENSSPLAKQPCGCGSGLAALIARARRSPGLGDDTSSPSIVPAGSQLVYNATYSPSLLNRSVQDVSAQVGANVSANAGISVIGGKATAPGLTGAGKITLTLQLKQDYTTQAMVQSVMDSALAAVSDGVIASNISVASGPSAGQGNAPLPGLPGAGPAPPGTPDPNAPFDLGNFLTTYGGWIVAGVVGFVLVRKIL